MKEPTLIKSKAFMNEKGEQKLDLDFHEMLKIEKYLEQTLKRKPTVEDMFDYLWNRQKQ